MRVLITGNMGYVGSVLIRHLHQNYPNSELIGYDTGFFAHALTGSVQFPEIILSEQVFDDIRLLNKELLQGVDAVVHLAAISNDPMGKEFEQVTQDINRRASVELAKAAGQAGVKSFVFASSCSMYGSADDGPRKENDPTHPLTAYARSKIGTEHDLRNVDLGNMLFTSLRFATACGMSERLRLDLVLNDFVACALSSGEITVLSDGTPWRPLIDVADMARAIDWAINRNADNGGQWLAVNAGKNSNNYQVIDLAEAVRRIVPGTVVSINTTAPRDKRSYQVDFSLFESLASDHLPQIDLDLSITRLVDGFRRMGFANADFRDSSFVRLNMLRQHLAAERLDQMLYWTKHAQTQL